MDLDPVVPSIEPVVRRWKPVYCPERNNTRQSSVLFRSPTRRTAAMVMRFFRSTRMETRSHCQPSEPAALARRRGRRLARIGSLVCVGSPRAGRLTIPQRFGDFPAGKLDNFTSILLELRARPSGESLLRYSPQWVTDHAPVTGSVLCGARPGCSDWNRTARRADRWRWARMGHRYLSFRHWPLAVGSRIDLGRSGRCTKCVSHGATMAKIRD
jgi:hypothetical protein